jgi:hypothetical protein
MNARHSEEPQATKNLLLEKRILRYAQDDNGKHLI